MEAAVSLTQSHLPFIFGIEMESFGVSDSLLYGIYPKSLHGAAHYGSIPLLDHFFNTTRRAGEP